MNAVLPPDKLTPGRRLRVERRKAGLTQEQLAEQLGVEVATLSAWENNREEMSDAAARFIMETREARGARASAPELEPVAPDLGEPEPSPRSSDRPPKAEPSPRFVPPPQPEIDTELEQALLKLFAGEAFLVPKQGADGTVTHEQAVIPGVAQVVGMFDQFDGMVIQAYAPGMAHAWAQLAAENENVKKMLIFVTYGGAWRGVMVATAPPLLAIMAHHSLLPTRQVVAAEPEDGSGLDEPPPPQPA